MDPVEFGKKIREFRKEKGLTLIQLGEKIDLTQSYLSYIENGKKGMPQPSTIKKLAYGLGVSYQYLMELAEYTDHEYYIDEILLNYDRDSFRSITVDLPEMEYKLNNDGVKVIKMLSDEELKRRLFDLDELLEMPKVDIFHKGRILTDREKTGIKAILDMVMEMRRG